MKAQYLESMPMATSALFRLSGCCASPPSTRLARADDGLRAGRRPPHPPNRGFQQFRPPRDEKGISRRIDLIVAGSAPGRSRIPSPASCASRSSFTRRCSASSPRHTALRKEPRCSRGSSIARRNTSSSSVTAVTFTSEHFPAEKAHEIGETAPHSAFSASKLSTPLHFVGKFLRVALVEPGEESHAAGLPGCRAAGTTRSAA